ncbi:hypothetical protein PR048_009784 [Dryococelus australis]|uniref:Uncharacterized protein n=1 Tax=Dryococelus australis TaxID=614101 RepID=A0ABQ9I0W2_9NEOP|nr:hypothetical protein PR048_009784 [Dryococelus australis]
MGGGKREIPEEKPANQRHRPARFPQPRVFCGLIWQQARLDSTLYTRDIIVCLFVASELALLLPAYYWLAVKWGVSEELPSNHDNRRKENPGTALPLTTDSTSPGGAQRTRPLRVGTAEVGAEPEPRQNPQPVALRSQNLLSEHQTPRRPWCEVENPEGPPLLDVLPSGLIVQLIGGTYTSQRPARSRDSPPPEESTSGTCILHVGLPPERDEDPLKAARGSEKAEVTVNGLYLSPTLVNRVRLWAESLPDFRTWESCRTMSLVGEFSWGSPVSHALAFRRCSIPTSIHPQAHWLERSQVGMQWLSGYRDTKWGSSDLVDRNIPSWATDVQRFYHTWETCRTLPLVSFSAHAHFPRPSILLMLHLHLFSPALLNGRVGRHLGLMQGWVLALQQCHDPLLIPSQPLYTYSFVSLSSVDSITRPQRQTSKLSRPIGKDHKRCRRGLECPRLWLVPSGHPSSILGSTRAARKELKHCRAVNSSRHIENGSGCGFVVTRCVRRGYVIPALEYGLRNGVTRLAQCGRGPSNPGAAEDAFLACSTFQRIGRGIESNCRVGRPSQPPFASSLKHFRTPLLFSSSCERRCRSAYCRYGIAVCWEMWSTRFDSSERASDSAANCMISLQHQRRAHVAEYKGYLNLGQKKHQFEPTTLFQRYLKTYSLQKTILYLPKNNRAPVHNVCSVVVTPLESRRATWSDMS